MKTVILVLIFTLTLYAAALAQSNFTDDTFVITTYYPAPYGVYRNMRLQPSDDPTGREGVVEGVMYYDQTLHMMRYLNDTGWVNVTAGGGGEGYWTKSGNSIHNNNTGNVNIGTNPTQTLEVSGKIFMRNETNATDPSYTVATRGYLSAFTSPILKVYTGAETCPGGSDMLMKCIGSPCIWYDVDNPIGGSPSKIMCGKSLTKDDSTGLTNGQHTSAQCGLKGGSPYYDTANGKWFCQFSQTSCANIVDTIPWSAYDNWRQVPAQSVGLDTSCYANCGSAIGSATSSCSCTASISSSPWSDSMGTTGSCTCTGSTRCCMAIGGCYSQSCTASATSGYGTPNQVGCY